MYFHTYQCQLVSVTFPAKQLSNVPDTVYSGPSKSLASEEMCSIKFSNGILSFLEVAWRVAIRSPAGLKRPPSQIGPDRFEKGLNACSIRRARFWIQSVSESLSGDAKNDNQDFGIIPLRRLVNMLKKIHDSRNTSYQVFLNFTKHIRERRSVLTHKV